MSANSVFSGSSEIPPVSPEAVGAIFL